MREEIYMQRKWLMGAMVALASLSTVPLPVSRADEAKPVDAQTRKELQSQEERLRVAIEKRDAAALSEILADYYADSRGDEEKAVTKPGIIARAKAGTLSFYRIEKEARFTAAGSDFYDVQGEAKSPPETISDQPIKERWVRVRRVWAKKDGHWFLIMQNIREAEEDERDSKEK